MAIGRAAETRAFYNARQRQKANTDKAAEAAKGFAVHNVKASGESYTDPKTHHATMEEAQAEAKRLAGLNPGSSFAVHDKSSGAAVHKEHGAQSKHAGKTEGSTMPTPTYTYGDMATKADVAYMKARKSGSAADHRASVDAQKKAMESLVESHRMRGTSHQMPSSLTQHYRDRIQHSDYHIDDDARRKAGRPTKLEEAKQAAEAASAKAAKSDSFADHKAALTAHYKVLDLHDAASAGSEAIDKDHAARRALFAKVDEHQKKRKAAEDRQIKEQTAKSVAKSEGLKAFAKPAAAPAPAPAPASARSRQLEKDVFRRPVVDRDRFSGRLDDQLQEAHSHAAKMYELLADRAAEEGDRKKVNEYQRKQDKATNKARDYALGTDSLISTERANLESVHGELAQAHHELADYEERRGNADAARRLRHNRDLQDAYAKVAGKNDTAGFNALELAKSLPAGEPSRERQTTAAPARGAASEEMESMRPEKPAAAAKPAPAAAPAAPAAAPAAPVASMSKEQHKEAYKAAHAEAKAHELKMRDGDTSEATKRAAGEAHARTAAHARAAGLAGVAVLHEKAAAKHGHTGGAAAAPAASAGGTGKTAALRAVGAKAREAKPKALQRGKKGGTFYVSEGGKKIYTKG